MKYKLGAVVMLLALTACQGNERLVEKAGLEGAVTADKQITAENENLKRRAQELEADLSKRQNFFQAVSGTYEGTLQTDQGTFNMRITMVPSLPRYTAVRTRMPEEVVADLNSLTLNTQVVQWHPSNSMSATGCRVMGIRPDMNNGELTLASAECPNFYSIRVTESEAGGKTESEQDRVSLQRKWLEHSGQSAKIAQNILDGKGAPVEQLVGEMKPTTNAAVYYFILKRSEQ